MTWYLKVFWDPIWGFCCCRKRCEPVLHGWSNWEDAGPRWKVYRPHHGEDLEDIDDHSDGRLMAFVSAKSGGWSTRAGSSYPPSREQFLRSFSIIMLLWALSEVRLIKVNSDSMFVAPLFHPFWKSYPLALDLFHPGCSPTSRQSLSGRLLSGTWRRRCWKRLKIRWKLSDRDAFRWRWTLRWVKPQEGHLHRGQRSADVRLVCRHRHHLVNQTSLAGYRGLSCEQCATGHYRDLRDRWTSDDNGAAMYPMFMPHFLASEPWISSLGHQSVTESVSATLEFVHEEWLIRVMSRQKTKRQKKLYCDVRAVLPSDPWISVLCSNVFV